MDAKVRVHGHFNGLKTTLLFALMWAIIMLIWWATGGSRQTLSIYIVIGLITTFGTYWFSDKLAIASMGAREVSEQEAPEIYQIVRELSAKAGKPMPRIYIAPTMSPNAFATGRNERCAGPRTYARVQPRHPDFRHRLCHGHCHLLPWLFADVFRWRLARRPR